MPTILRFRNFRIMIFVDDHLPPHVHAIGPGCDASFFLNCPKGPVTLRESNGTSVRQNGALVSFLSDNISLLCEAWETIDDQRKGA